MKDTNKLNSKELIELKGGDSMSQEREVVNLNRVQNCVCYYLNNNTITNTNETDQCRCTCYTLPTNQQ